MPAWALSIVIPLAYITFWGALIYVIGGFSGWRAIASRYPATTPFEGTVRRFQRFQLGWTNYGGCVSVGTNAEGLYLATFFLFRFGHPPAFIPWGEITAGFVRKWYGGKLELRFARVPSVVLRMPERLGRQVAGDANKSWAEGNDRQLFAGEGVGDSERIGDDSSKEPSARFNRED